MGVVPRGGPLTAWECGRSRPLLSSASLGIKVCFNSMTRPCYSRSHSLTPLPARREYSRTWSLRANQHDAYSKTTYIHRGSRHVFTVSCPVGPHRGVDECVVLCIRRRTGMAGRRRKYHVAAAPCGETCSCFFPSCRGPYIFLRPLWTLLIPSKSLSFSARCVCSCPSGVHGTGATSNPLTTPVPLPTDGTGATAR